MKKCIVCVSVNWLGDAVMAMPALQQLRARHLDARIVMLTRPALCALWEAHEDVDEVLTYDRGWSGMWRGVKVLQEVAPDVVYILPHSFRTALIPWLARVSVRVGTGGVGRSWMLTDRVVFSDVAREGHQAFEIAELLGSPFPQGEVAEIKWSVSGGAKEGLGVLVGGMEGAPIVLIPGAARGPSKQWPAAHFVELARLLLDEWKVPVWLLGTRDDVEVCHEINQALMGRALNLCGGTSLMEFAAALDQAQAVVANDSGGMHLATAVGTPVVALFGLTSPKKTGPLGSKSMVLQGAEGGSRTIKRNAEDARKALANIKANEVVKALQILLG